MVIMIISINIGLPIIKLFNQILALLTSLKYMSFAFNCSFSMDDFL